MSIAPVSRATRVGSTAHRNSYRIVTLQWALFPYYYYIKLYPSRVTLKSVEDTALVFLELHYTLDPIYTRHTALRDTCIHNERLQSHDQPLLKELTTVLADFEEELLPAADATEMLDVMGWLGDVLSESADADTWLGLR